MRSVYKYMKFIKNWFLLVQGPSQIPSFINYKINDEGIYEIINNNNTENDIKLKIIFHKDIFPNISNLPNFCSSCIESSFAFIQEISECFIYFNDDFFVNKDIHPGYFIKKNGRINLYRELRIAPSIIGSWDYQIAYTNNLLNDIFGFQRRMYADHFPYFLKNLFYKS